VRLAVPQFFWCSLQFLVEPRFAGLATAAVKTFGLIYVLVQASFWKLAKFPELLSQALPTMALMSFIKRSRWNGSDGPGSNYQLSYHSLAGAKRCKN
jgi:hypothetical protein